MTPSLSPRVFAREESRDLEVADVRLRRRVQQMLVRLAQGADGRVTRVFAREAERDGAYALLSNPRVTVSALADAAHRAAARRCRGERVAIVPIDGSSLSIADRWHTKGTGPVGRRSKPGRGFLVISALLIVARIVVGLGAMQFWKRPETRRKRHRHSLSLAQKESRFWLEAMRTVVAHLAAEAPECRPWFQLDRGGDIHWVLREAVAQGWMLTVRSQNDRRLGGPRPRYLRRHLQTRTLQDYLYVQVPARPGRAARVAKLAVRLDPCVPLQLTDRSTHRKSVVTLGAVHAREVGTVPRGEKPIEWYLLTTVKVTTFAQAVGVLEAYAMRWEIEVFHHAWKSGICQVERTQLRAADRLQKWMVMLASVAARALRLTHASRETPEAPALEYFEAAEIEAAVVLRRPRGYRVDAEPTLGQMTEWIADLGGWNGRSSSGPPGKAVLARGLVKLAIAVDALRGLRALGPPRAEKSQAKRKRPRRCPE